jgi:hypothetical protein
MEQENPIVEQNEDASISPTLSDLEVFKKLLTAPKEAFTFIDEYRFEKHSILLIILFGISYCMDTAIDKQWGNNSSLLSLFFIITICGSIGGYLYINLYAMLLGVTGNWLKGKAIINDFLRVLPYAMLPSAIGIIHIILAIFLSGIDVFTNVEQIAEYSPIIGLLVGILLIFKGILGIWSFVLMVLAVSVIQKFSIGRALANVMLPAVLIVSVIAGILIFFRTFAILENLF